MRISCNENLRTANQILRVQIKYLCKRIYYIHRRNNLDSIILLGINFLSQDLHSKDHGLLEA